MKSQVTTKKGDTGETGALSGDRYPKSHPIMECVGTLDELRVHTAMARLRIVEEQPEGHRELADFLFWLLHVYFLIGSACSDPFDRHPEYRKGRVSRTHLDKLEAFQQRIEEQTPLPHAFIVSPRTMLAAQVDLACTTVRRLERNLVRLKEAVPEFDGVGIFAFVNRLSDSMYMLARYVERPDHCTVDYSVLDRE
jgi:cob(I)alamin adenosyltransferase